jgi:ABC-type polysaccharide/polyol phosphate transport system ATPase subunit
MGSDMAVTVEDVSKRFRLYHERNQSLKAALMRRKRAVYEEFWALRDVSFEVPVGSSFALIGHNGSGKSTLLKCMAQILRVDAGRIAVNGKVSALLELGAGFHPELSGRDNVYLNGSILGLSRKQLEARFDDIVGFAGLEKFIDTPVKSYSSGMYVRLGFSIAINVDPDVLLVDEVLAVGDQAFQSRCAEKFSELRRSGKTIVLVSHQLDTVRTLCDSAVWLEHGEVKALGAPGELIDRYGASDPRAERLEEPTSGGLPLSGPDTTEPPIVPDSEPDAPVAVPGRPPSGGVDIVGLELLDDRGEKASTVRTGDTVTLRLSYDAVRPVPDPVFILDLHSVTYGVYVSGPNNWHAGERVEKISGPGSVDLYIERLLLVPGIYDVSVSICDVPGSTWYDSRLHLLRFVVETGEPWETAGVTSLGGSWRIRPSGSS